MQNETHQSVAKPLFFMVLVLAAGFLLTKHLVTGLENQKTENASAGNGGGLPVLLDENVVVIWPVARTLGMEKDSPTYHCAATNDKGAMVYMVSQFPEAVVGEAPALMWDDGLSKTSWECKVMSESALDSSGEGLCQPPKKSAKLSKRKWEAWLHKMIFQEVMRLRIPA